MNSDGRFYCDICPNKSYSSIPNLKRHKRVECQRTKQFKCEKCEKQFYFKSDCNRHLKHHILD